MLTNIKQPTAPEADPNPNPAKRARLAKLSRIVNPMQVLVPKTPVVPLVKLKRESYEKIIKKLRDASENVAVLPNSQE